jgi:hypothetical protein
LAWRKVGLLKSMSFGPTEIMRNDVGIHINYPGLQFSKIFEKDSVFEEY